MFKDLFKNRQFINKLWYTMDTDTGAAGACPGWEWLAGGVSWGERRHM